MPALMYAYIYKLQTGKKSRVILLTIAVYISALLTWSGGVLIVLSVITVVYIFFRKKTLFFNYYSYWLLQIVYFLVIIIFQLQNIFRWLIDDILNKWTSLEGRMNIWLIELQNILNSPIYGYGVEYNEQRRIYYIWANHSHNLLLEVLHQGGVIYLVLLIIVIIMAGKNIMKYSHTETAQIISLAILGWSIHGMVEPTMSALHMGILIVAYHCNSLEQTCITKGQKKC